MKRGLILAGIVVAALVIAAGTVLTIQRVSDDEATTSEPTPIPTQTPTEEAEQPPDIDPDDRDTLEALALEAATIMTTWDPNEDFNQTAAELRAADMMTDELAEEIVAPERPTTGTEWLEAAEAQATSEPTVEVNQGTESEVVSAIATWTWTDPEDQTVSTSDERRAFYFAFPLTTHETAGHVQVGPRHTARPTLLLLLAQRRWRCQRTREDQMARPYRGDRVQVTTKLPVPAFEKLERYVNATGQKKQDFTSAAILAALEDIDIDKIEGQEPLPLTA